MKGGCLAGLVVLVGLVAIALYHEQGTDHGEKASIAAPLANPTAMAVIERYARSWGVSEPVDEVSGRRYSVASIRSVNTITQLPPYGETGLTISFHDHPRYGRMMSFAIDEGQLVCGVWDCQGEISFDGKVERLSLRTPEDRSSTVLLAAHPDAILKKMNTAKKTVVSLTLYREGAPAFTFEPPEPLSFKD